MATLSTVTNGSHEHVDDRSPPSVSIVRDNCLAPLGLGLTETARVQGVVHHSLSRVVNGRAKISPQLTIRLKRGGSSKAEF